MGKELANRLRLLRWSITSVGLTVTSLVLFVGAAAGAGLITVWVGFAILVVTIGGARKLATHRRRYAGGLLGRSLDSPYLRDPEGTPLMRVAALAGDPAVRRDMLWIFLDGTVGLALSLIGVVEGLLDLLFWWLPPGIAARVHARIDCALLGTSEKSRLALRVQELTESRAETVDTSAAELRRIERDLHDGAQARLVSLGMSLGMAEDEIARNPDGARALLAEARESSHLALVELRDLVRGIHPPVLADRGLVGAVQALCLASPIPVEVRSDLTERLSAPVESAAYFAVAEALTNVIKHSGAAQAEVHISQREGRLELEVRDVGAGGADPGNGTGLRGIERRLSAFDGTLSVDSPHGGPTVVSMTLPSGPPAGPPH